MLVRRRVRTLVVIISGTVIVQGQQGHSSWQKASKRALDKGALLSNLFKA